MTANEKPASRLGNQADQATTYCRLVSTISALTRIPLINPPSIKECFPLFASQAFSFFSFLHDSGPPMSFRANTVILFLSSGKVWENCRLGISQGSSLEV